MCGVSVMLYGSKTWAVKDDDIQRLKDSEMRMVRWMCGASLRSGGVRGTEWALNTLL